MKILESILLAVAISWLAACVSAASGRPVADPPDPFETPHSAPAAARTQPPSTTVPEAVPTPIPTGSSAQSFFWVVEMTPKDDDASDDVPLTVALARFGTLTVQTMANATCVAGGKLPSGAPITSGLGARRANSAGVVSWNFAAATAERGTGSYTLTCGSGPNLHTVTAFFWMP